MALPQPDVVVIGAGVTGLTTGICLAEAGRTVTIRSATLPDQTTSVAAGAIWGPVHVGRDERVLPWAERSLEVLTGLATDPDTGVRMVSGMEARRIEAGPPFWSPLLPSLRMCEPGELPPGFTGGWYYTAPLATMPVYLGYLRSRFEQAGGTIELSEVTELNVAPLVVNCTGVAARDLVPDPAVYPVRGQVVITENPGIKEFFISRDEIPPASVYMFPHGDTVLLGGTVEEDDWDLTPNPLIAERIVANAAVIDPRLGAARILGHRVGLRPIRSEVRLESERIGDSVVWHNYGHGGAGISLSWGCAAEVARRITNQPEH